MSEPFIAEIRIFAGDFAPRGWAFCDGQVMPIESNKALFSLIGATYGGDGATSMALPNLQGRAPMHPGRGPGLSPRRWGEVVGTETVTLSEAQLPTHKHEIVTAENQGAADVSPNNNAALSRSSFGDNLYQTESSANLTDLAPVSVSSAGGGQPHNNLQPYLALNFIIALFGLYPSR